MADDADAIMLQIARNLADALMEWAYTRKSEDKDAVLHLESTLCKNRRAELAEAAEAAKQQTEEGLKEQ